MVAKRILFCLFFVPALRSNCAESASKKPIPVNTVCLEVAHNNQRIKYYVWDRSRVLTVAYRTAFDHFFLENTASPSYYAYRITKKGRKEQSSDESLTTFNELAKQYKAQKLLAMRRTVAEQQAAKKKASTS